MWCYYYYAWWYGYTYCYNGGTCYYNGTDYVCSCNQGWDPTTGCQTVLPCMNVTCYNGGTCMSNGTEYYCLCNAGLDPTTNCQTEINKDPCDDENTGEVQNLALRTSSTPNVGLCDQNLHEKWYKAYGYEMISYDPGSNRCGSKNPIYLTGSIPNDTDVNNLTACLRDQDDACTTNLSVLVKKCDADTIFYLSPTPTCNSTYCFDQVDMSDKATTWTPSSMHISFYMTWTNTATPKPGIVYRCIFRFSTGNLWYKIKWYINDIKVAESEYVQKDSVGIAENTTLTEKYIEAYGVTVIIKTISCWSPRIFCVCGIVVQAGKDIFVINTCPGSIPMMRFYRCNDGLLRATSDISVAYSHRERGKSECADLLKQNVTLRQEYSDIVTVIEANNCPNECSFHGSCVAGNCMCNNGFAAKDCSTNLTAGININGNSDNGFCDTSEGTCEEIEIYGEPFPEDIHPISRFTPFTQGYENGTKIFYPSVKIQGEQQKKLLFYKWHLFI
ncbi:hypothetical protein KUTeg_011962 [Tegillarca granosa]|uniref:EGF-like domain-containing protein n=1 Tax=Tegillarca granosa TaxID=220873 RepID=A0ABQ9F1E4_TEGGR|nr:hypothetical protein KUTeg_011962 [Tegillarca granosa]